MSSQQSVVEEAPTPGQCRLCHCLNCRCVCRLVEALFWLPILLVIIGIKALRRLIRRLCDAAHGQPSPASTLCDWYYLDDIGDVVLRDWLAVNHAGGQTTANVHQATAIVTRKHRAPSVIDASLFADKPVLIVPY